MRATSWWIDLLPATKPFQIPVDFNPGQFERFEKASIILQ
jgi:hypothetical protein